MNVRIRHAGLLDKVAAKAETVERRLHFDSLAPEHADRTFAAIARLRSRHPKLSLSVSLPGRWERSVADADWAIRHGVAVRVVKGQWADPAAEYASCVAATPVYELFGLKGVPAGELPAAETPLLEGQIGYHLRTGDHDLTPYDWGRVLDFGDGKW